MGVMSDFFFQALDYEIIFFFFFSNFRKCGVLF